ncbi:MAG: hypothetical protein WC319_09745 [Candidatus Paceibacterota bacterium]|jgi:hypothetical protein
MSVIGRLVVSIVGNNTELKKSLQDTDKLLSKQTKNINYIADQMGKAGKIMTLGVTLPIMGIGVAFGKMAMEAVESESLFEVSMGSMADSARKWSEQLSDSLGLNQYELRKTAGVFNVMFDSMGLAEEASYNMSTSLTELAYDMASFYNLNTEDAIQKLQAGITGEAEPLKRLGIIINETTVYQTALREGIIQTGEQMTEQEKVQARYRTIMDQTAKAQGDLARTIESPANQLRVLKDQVKETAISFGELLLPAMSSMLGVANDMVSKFKDMDDPTKKLITNMALIVAGAGPALLALSSMTKAVTNLRTAFVLLKTIGFAKVLGTAGTIGLIGGGIAGVTALVWEGVTAWKAYQVWTKNALNDLSESEQYLRMAFFKSGVQDMGLSNLSSANVGKYKEEFRGLLEDLVALSDKYPELSKEIIQVSNDLKNGTINTAEARIELLNLKGAYSETGQSFEQLTNRLDAADKGMNDYAKTTDEATMSIEEQKQAVDELRDEFNKLLGDIFGHITTYNDFEEANIAVKEAEKALAEAIKEHGEQSDEATRAQNDLDDAMIGSIQTAFELSTSIEATAKQQEEARKKAVELGLEFINTGQIGVEQFWKMASEFGLSAAEIIRLAGEMGIEIDEATRDRMTVLDIDDAVARAEINEYIKLIANIPASVQTRVEARANIIWSNSEGNADGGVIGYANGGIANKVLSASSGMITPSYDNGGILSLLHKNEVVLNSKQTRNLAELIFGLANTRFADSQEYGNTGQPLIIKNVIELDGSIIYEKTEEHLYRSQRLKQIGAGIR